jgi:hypothetical protein
MSDIGQANPPVSRSGSNCANSAEARLVRCQQDWERGRLVRRAVRIAPGQQVTLPLTLAVGWVDEPQPGPDTAPRRFSAAPVIRKMLQSDIGTAPSDL